MAPSGNEKIDYKSAFQKLVPRVSIDEDGAELISNLLNDVNKQLVTKMEQAYKSESKIYDTTFSKCAKKAVENVFVGNTKKLALSEAFKQLALLESGCMIYKDDSGPSTFRKKPATEKDSREQAYEKRNQTFISLFKSGVMKFSANTLPNIFLNKDAGHLLGLRIYSFAKMVAEFAAKNNSKKEELQPTDIKNILFRYLGKDTLRAANAEGVKCLTLFSNDLFELKARREINSRWSRDSVAREKIFSSVFKPSIRALLKEINPNLVIDSRLPKYLGHIQLDLARYLAQNSSEICKKKKAIEMDFEDLYQSASTVLPEQLKLHALLNASNDVWQYQRGFLVYDREPDKPKVAKTKTIRKRKISARSKPEKKIKRSTPTRKRKGEKVQSSRSNKSKSFSSGAKPQDVSAILYDKNALKSETINKSFNQKEKDNIKKLLNIADPSKQIPTPVRLNFSPAITDVLPDVFENIHMSIAKDSRNNLCKILEDACDAIASVSISAADSKQLGTNEVNVAISKLFPAPLKELAEAFGRNVVQAWEDDKNQVPLK